MKNLVVDYKFDIKANMDEVKKGIAEDMAKYDIVVTADTVKDTKKVMADINKQKAEFKTTCKEFINEVSQPINAFKSSQKEIESLFDDARSNLDIQVKRYEQGVLDLAESLLIEYVKEKSVEKEINPDLIEYKDLILLGTVTQSGNMSSGAKEKIDARIMAVETEILKAKLEAEEKAKRDREIAEHARIEAERRAAEREAMLKAQSEEREARLKIEAEEREKRMLEESKKREDDLRQKANIPEKKEAVGGKKIVYIRIDVKVEVSENVSNQSIVDRVKSILPDSIKDKKHSVYAI